MSETPVVAHSCETCEKISAEECGSLCRPPSGDDPGLDAWRPRKPKPVAGEWHVEVMPRLRERYLGYVGDFAERQLREEIPREIMRHVDGVANAVVVTDLWECALCGSTTKVYADALHHLCCQPSGEDVGDE